MQFVQHTCIENAFMFPEAPHDKLSRKSKEKVMLVDIEMIHVVWAILPMA